MRTSRLSLPVIAAIGLVTTAAVVSTPPLAHGQTATRHKRNDVEEARDQAAFKDMSGLRPSLYLLDLIAKPIII